MTRPSGARCPPWSSQGRRSASHVLPVTSKRAWSLLEAVSSGPKTRKAPGLSRMMSRSQRPKGAVFMARVAPGASTATAWARWSPSLSGLRSNPPLASGRAPMRAAPEGASTRNSGSRAPDPSNSSPGR